MKAREVRSINDARTIIEERGLSHVKVGVFDVDGILRGKYMAKDKFYSALENGFGFCDVVLGWDSNDQLYENPGVEYTGWHTGYPDAPVSILPDTCRDLPMEGENLLFLGQFADKAAEVCPRATLVRVLEKARSMGYEVKASFEYEFFLFEETPHSVREKNYRDLTPITPGFFGYSVIRNSVHADLHLRMLELCESMDFALEGLHTETGPGVLEAAIRVDEASSAADKAALFKTFIKVMAQMEGLMATFMAKWSNDYPGQSGHIHLSLADSKTGENLFFDANGESGMSRLQRQFVAGQQKLMPEVLAMIAPTVNSYSRMIPGFWAPTHATWGIENRTTALRVIPGNAKSQRVEYRLAASDANPYIALAAAVASGLYGIEKGLEPDPVVRGNAYDKDHPAHQALPQTLDQSAWALRKSEAARALFGDAFVDHFATSREWEAREFRKHITDWELARYFEII